MFENVELLGKEPSITFAQEIVKHLLLFKDEIKHYFFNDGDAQACTYTRNSFLLSLMIYQWEQKELIDLQCDDGAQKKFKDFTLANFWLNVSFYYLTLAKNVITQLLVFPTTWEYKQRFTYNLFLQSSRKLETVW